MRQDGTADFPQIPIENKNTPSCIIQDGAFLCVWLLPIAPRADADNTLKELAEILIVREPLSLGDILDAPVLGAQPLLHAPDPQTCKMLAEADTRRLFEERREIRCVQMYMIGDLRLRKLLMAVFLHIAQSTADRRMREPMFRSLLREPRAEYRTELHGHLERSTLPARQSFPKQALKFLRRDPLRLKKGKKKPPPLPESPPHCLPAPPAQDV